MGLVQTAVVTVQLAVPGVYKICAASGPTHLDSDFQLIAGVLLMVEPQSLSPAPFSPPLPPRLPLSPLAPASPQQQVAALPPPAPSLVPLVDDGADGLSVTTDTPSVQNALDCSLSPEKRFGRHETWQLEVILNAQLSSMVSLQLQQAIAKLCDIRCESDIQFTWLSTTHLEVLIYGLRPGRSPAYLQATKRSSRLELEFHRHHVNSQNPYVLPGTNVSIVQYEWERSAFHHFVSASPSKSLSII